MARRALSLVALALALAGVHAHPPVDVPLDSLDVQAAASEAVRARNHSVAARGAAIASWRVVSAQRQMVNGFMFFLVVAAGHGRLGSASPYLDWRLASVAVYTTFEGEVQSNSWEESPLEVASPRDGPPEDEEVGACGKELSAPAPLVSTASVQVTRMSAMLVSSHVENVTLRSSWWACGDTLTSSAVVTDRYNQTHVMPKATHTLQVCPTPTSSTKWGWTLDNGWGFKWLGWDRGFGWGYGAPGWGFQRL
ncbi:hypothetical protein AB1Y20_006561 [Prymnesium parvum]|uniref:Phospholipase B-like n=1 Tax=Prymnesium parvum TaxID=97485 RepID=A0AB34J112_PRYPA